jgi:PKD repeat protein
VYTVTLTVTDVEGVSDRDTTTAFVVSAETRNAKTQRASVSTSMAQGSADSGVQGLASQTQGDVAISGDGRFVAFTSRAANLVADDTNGRLDVFVKILTDDPGAPRVYERVGFQLTEDV